MTAKLAGKLEYNAATLAALAKWIDIGSKKPKRTYGRKWCVKKRPAKSIPKV